MFVVSGYKDKPCFFQALFGTIAAVIGTGALVRSIPYQEGFGAKQMAWMLHVGVIGAIIAPLTLMGGPILVRAACYTAGIVGGETIMYRLLLCPS